jgi:hypothetical protein
MNRFRFPITVAVTSLALVAIIVGAGGLLIGNALANSPFMSAAAFTRGAWSGPWAGPPWAAGHVEWQLPPQLAGLADVPAGERFSHFRGVQVQLTDKDNKPLNVEVVPGTATAVTQSSLSMTANDGGSRTFTLDDKTAIHGAGFGQATQGATPTIKQNDHVIVVTLNNSSTATAVMLVSANGFGPHGPFGN